LCGPQKDTVLIQQYINYCTIAECSCSILSISCVTTYIWHNTLTIWYRTLLVECRILWGEPEWDTCSQCSFTTPRTMIEQCMDLRLYLQHRIWVDRLKQSLTSFVAHIAHWASTHAQQERWLYTWTAEAFPDVSLCCSHLCCYIQYTV